MINVTWDKNICSHAGVCVTTLPAVFKIEGSQLAIDTSAADEEKIREVCAACPSGALNVDKA
ncbi:MAG: (4Fe-4S)-binding protein [Sedimenticola sp.]|nr:(4Fe-4S)-binding protein [Sedimenticola sp.]